MYHSFLIHLSADGHLGCFHVLVITSSAVMNIDQHWGTRVSFPSGFLSVYAQHTKGHCHPRASSAKTRGFHTQLDEGPETP